MNLIEDRLTQPGDRRLRSRVKYLGTVLGNVLKKQAGESVFNAVETLRTGFIALRNEEESDPKQHTRLMQVIEDLTPEELTHVIRAFNIYFNLVNLAEEVAQHHQRQQQRAAHPVDAEEPLWEGSFDETIRDFHKQGVTPAELQKLLNQLAYMPVMTAHPTEARRRTIMGALRRIFVIEDHIDNVRSSAVDKQEAEDNLEREIEILWKTDEVRTYKPSVEDEVQLGIYYYQQSLFSAVPRVYRNLERRIRNLYFDGDAQAARSGPNKIEVPPFIRFGSWIGGDRDGNPYVTPKTTETAVLTYAQVIIEEYIKRIGELAHILTHSSTLAPLSDELEAQLKLDQISCKAMSPEEMQKFINEPYRRRLFVILHRLRYNLEYFTQRLNSQTGRGALEEEEPEKGYGAYPSVADFREDLRIMYDSLVANGDERSARGDLLDLIRLVETFGFHLLHLDIRQSSERHTTAVAELIATSDLEIDYNTLAEEERLDILAKAIEQDRPLNIPSESLTEETRETLEVFSVMARLREEVGNEAFGHYIVSMTHNASHLLEVMFLARQTGLVGHELSGDFCHIRVTPLFETIDDLERLESVLSQLFENPTYRRLLEISGNLQEIMLGYSYSCQDGGILASSWKLYESQCKITALTQKHGIECRLFHGRGGTIGRGGGPTHDSILAQPTGTVHGQVKFTEQGETLYYKYANVETARYELVMGITGLMKASLNLVRPVQEEKGQYRETMQQLSQLGTAHYHQLVDETPGLMDYFYEATPVLEIGMLNLGSGSFTEGHLEQNRSRHNIRAIPWVFGWAQSRHTLPAWYGIGTALEKWREDDPERFHQLRKMVKTWPYFRALLSNTQMALSKGDMEIAEQYAQLCTNKEQAEVIFGMIRDEYAKTKAQVLEILQNDFLIQDNPRLALSLSRRNPYLDPLNHVQIALHKRFIAEETAEAEKELWMQPLLRTINAISNGMRNTG